MTAADRDREAFEAWCADTFGPNWATHIWPPERDMCRKTWQAALTHARAQAGEPVAGRKVPDGQTPLDANLKHRYLDVIKEGEMARESGTGSPYHGHSLEHCLHAVGWVHRDLRIALDQAKSHPAPAQEPVAVPAGWKLVPETPTEEMQRAGWIDKEDVTPADIYGAMLAAAPVPPPAESGEDNGRLYAGILKRGAACAVTDGVKEALASVAAPQFTPVVHVNFTCQDGPVTGLASAPVKSVTVNDDGSLRVDLDYWPASQPADHRRVQDAAPARPEMDALIAEAKAQAPQPGGAVKVKALEWEKYWAGGDDQGSKSWMAWRPTNAITGSAALTIYMDGDSWTEGTCESGKFPDLDTAKQARQDDYERRILSALEPTPTSDWNAGTEVEVPPSALDQPRAWWAETGTAGAGEGCNKPFWLRHEAIDYVRQHGGHVAPLFRRYEAPPQDRMILMPTNATEEMLAATHDASGHMRLLEFTMPEERSKPFLIMRACYRAMVDHVRKGGA
ncbi:hypothetical protein V5F49_20220 [Xanthobacter sp. V3C-3]|uniref:hypothetical protein n=1 Tax=Xanthobacter lutulentifluminis TaxID=3119935 RepID=UPI0037273F1B